MLAAVGQGFGLASPSDTSKIEALDLPSTVAATLPKFRLSPWMRSTPRMKRSAPTAAISCRIDVYGAALARSRVTTLTS